jgi:hypothetical protein
VQRIRDGHTGRVLGSRAIERSAGAVLRAVCTMHVVTRSTSFLVEPQNHWDGLSAVWPQNHWDNLSVVWPQNWWRPFLPVWPQNRWLG